MGWSILDLNAKSIELWCKCGRMQSSLPAGICLFSSRGLGLTCFKSPQLPGELALQFLHSEHLLQCVPVCLQTDCISPLAH